MPILKAGSQLVYFAHVPKCGGTAVANHLAARFGPLAFEDRQFLKPDAPERWTRTSPQHVDVASLRRLFPPGFFDVVFAVVRHPVDRAISAFHFLSDVQQTIDPEVEFSDWLEGLADPLRNRPFHNDNHHLPMVDFVPEGAEVFRIEDGLHKVADWLTARFGPVEGVPAISLANARSQLKKFPRTQRPRTVPSAADLQRIRQIFDADFVRFDYRCEADGRCEAVGATRQMGMQ